MVLLTRHTRPAVPADLCYGRLEVPLAATAPIEIEAVCARLSAVERVVTSPAQRCIRLARAVATRFGASLECEPDLRELDFGDWEGRSWSQIGRPALDAWSRDLWSYRPGGGESLADLWGRVVNMVQRRKLERVHAAPGCLLIVAHHGPLRVLQCLADGRGWAGFSEPHFAFGVLGLRVWRSTI
jgi:alpha-ribazole phosphatase